MNPSTINPDEMLKSMAAEAVKQHEQIRTTIRDLTLKTLQARDLSLEQINGVIRNITAGVNIGVGDKTDTQQTLSDAFAGMDDALLGRIVSGGIGKLSPVRGALAQPGETTPLSIVD